VNNSFSSLNQGSVNTPEPKALRERADPNSQVSSTYQLDAPVVHYLHVY
jgi:hypothetical protein